MKNNFNIKVFGKISELELRMHLRISLSVKDFSELLQNFITYFFLFQIFSNERMS
jgi:hypothetical protein